MEKLYFAKLREGAVIPSKRVEDAGYGREVCRPIASKVLNAVKEVIDNS